MKYQDFSPEDKQIIDEFLANYNAKMESLPYWYVEVYPEYLQDDEIFFRTKDEILEVVSELDERYDEGSYRDMADGLIWYFNEGEYEVADFEPVDLHWGHIARVGVDRYLFMSNSWSDSGVFLNRK